MKRWLFLMTALLVLTGCGGETEYTTPPTEYPSAFSAIAETDDGSMLEASASGSLEVYALDRTDSRRIARMGGDLLLFSGEKTTSLTLFTGEELQKGVEVTLDCAIDPDSPAVQISRKGVTYYDADVREIVILDSRLEKTGRISLPDTIIGSPALTADHKTVYYCTADALRSIDVDSGIDKLLKEMSYTPLTVTALHSNETILQCAAADNSGGLHTLFLSTHTGETLGQTLGEVTLTAIGDTYFAIHPDGAYTELLVGSDAHDVQLLRHEDTLSAAAPIPELNAAILVHTDEARNISRLELYALTGGTLSAAVNIPGAGEIRGFLGDSENQCVWFLRYDESSECDVLCRWDVALDAVEDETVYLTERPTAENPDEEGLLRCNAVATYLSDTYGVEILLWTDIEACQNEGSSLKAEYQVPVIERSLKQLEKALACYPKGFLTQAAAATDSGILKICLVRSVGSSETALQYWTGDSACIAVCPDVELERNFHHQLFFILENRVLGNCSTYDNWNSLNPKGFSYALSYDAEVDDQWLEGSERAFLDSRSMTYPREDRAAIMEYAVTSGNESCFESETMQKKLQKLCKGIRKAFDLEKSEETFLWEQYLEE